MHHGDGLLHFPVSCIIVFHPQKGTSILSRLVRAVRAWVEGRGEGVRAVSVQPLEGGATPAAWPATRVWISSAGVANLDHVLLYRKQEVRFNSEIE